MQVALVLVAALMLPWSGMVQSVPHNHSDMLVPQEALACAASGPTSKEVHLHGAGDLLAPHPCIACLAGSNHAAAPRPFTLGGVEVASPLQVARPHDLGSRNRLQLPMLRGPPAGV